MKTAVLQRLLETSQKTFGVFRLDRLKFFTAELPWKDNKANVSCIPTGVYICRWTLSPRLRRYTYEVTEVTGRSGIRIHSANFPRQLLGCIGFGETTGMMDGQRGVFASVRAIRKLETYMDREPFELEVRQ